MSHFQACVAKLLSAPWQFNRTSVEREAKNISFLIFQRTHSYSRTLCKGREISSSVTEILKLRIALEHRTPSNSFSIHRTFVVDQNAFADNFVRLCDTRELDVVWLIPVMIGPFLLQLLYTQRNSLREYRNP